MEFDANWASRFTLFGAHSKKCAMMSVARDYSVVKAIDVPSKPAARERAVVRIPTGTAFGG
jgi:hypothetical protein